MEKKNTIWVVVTWDNESARLTSKRSVKTMDEAENAVLTWYEESCDDENCEGAQIDSDNLFAAAYINGRDETIQAFEVEI